MTPRAEPFLAPVAYKLGRGRLGDATYLISRLLALWFETRRFFHVFLHVSHCKACEPAGAGPFLAPGGIIWTNLVEVHQVKLHTKYPDSRPYGFRQEDVFMFSLYKPM